VSDLTGIRKNQHFLGDSYKKSVDVTDQSIAALRLLPICVMPTTR
jgi:hypothetical protein